MNPVLILLALTGSYRNPLFINGMFPVLKSIEEGEREGNPDEHKHAGMAAQPTLWLLLLPEI